MRESAIHVYDVLLLKPDNDYGLKPGTQVLVTAIKPKPGYKTSWIMSGMEAYRASDFLRLLRHAYPFEIEDSRAAS